jgi:hypothetical protein
VLFSLIYSSRIQDIRNQLTFTSEINSIPLCMLNLGASIFTIVFGRSMDGSWLLPCEKWSKNHKIQGIHDRWASRPLHQGKKKSSLTVAGRNPRMVLQNGMQRILRETRKCRNWRRSERPIGSFLVRFLLHDWGHGFEWDWSLPH